MSSKCGQVNVGELWCVAGEEKGVAPQATGLQIDDEHFCTQKNTEILESFICWQNNRQFQPFMKVIKYGLQVEI